MKTYPIEDALKMISDESPRNQYFFEKYIVIKNVLFDKYYGHLLPNYSHFTDHGHKHINGIILQADRMCRNAIDPRFYDDEKYINLYELYLLLMSILFHDVAMLIEERAKHGDLTKIFYLFDGNILSEDEKDWITIFVKCHQSSVKIEDEITNKEKQINNWTVHPQFIAAILRLADELDEGKIRVNEISLELKTIPLENTIYHEYARRIDGIKPDPKHAQIGVEISVQKEDLFNKFKKNGTEVEMITEIIDRVDKINYERKYCMTFTAYYLEYKSVELKLFIKNGEKIEKQITHIFDDNKDKSRFWSEHRTVIEGYRR